MGPELGLLIVFVVFLGLLAWGMSVPFAVLIPALGYLYILGGIPGFRALGVISWANLNSFTLTAIPLFILMAEILEAGGLISRIYHGLSVIFSRVPGGLLQTNIAGSAIFAAVSGSSVTTAATIGSVALREMETRGYQLRISAGSVAAGGTLGILIPPSLAMIIYSTFTDTSVVKLFAAGMVPGIMLTSMFMLYVAARALYNPSLVPARDAEAVTMRHVLRAGWDILPIIVLIVLLLGSMYAGWATPTEAAALGCAGALAISLAAGSLSMRSLMAAISRTVLASGNILFLVFAAYVFAHALSFGGVGTRVTAFLISLDMSLFEFLVVLFVFYIILGAFIEGIGMIVLTVPLIFPILPAYGLDPIWFGVLLVMFIEMGQISPPAGINIFVIQGLLGGKYVDTVIGCAPFFFIIVLAAIVITIWPEIALWLPRVM